VREVVNILAAILLIPSGLFMLIRRDEVVRSGARFNQRMAKAVPMWGWANPNTSEEFWRYIAPVSGALMFAVGVAMLLLVPST